MNDRLKISSLSEKELAGLLKQSFFKVGKALKLAEDETKIFLDEVYRRQGWMFVDTFSDAFSRYAACELAGAEGLRPYASPMFIGRLMKIYFKKCWENKSPSKNIRNTVGILTPEEKYGLFINHIITHKRFPGNPDWVSVYEHLEGLKKIAPIAEWATLSYSKKMNYAKAMAIEWIYKNYNITE
jgi:hypothetical protein